MLLSRLMGAVAAVVVLAGCVGGSDAESLEVVAQFEYDMGADLQFQRRSGTHVVGGDSVNGVRDVVFASGHSDASRTDGAIEILDISDPREPIRLFRIPCPGYQSDVGVHENWLLQTVDLPVSNTGCNSDWLDETAAGSIDRSGVGGVRIFDVTDPAIPRLTAFIEVAGLEGVHNVTILPWANMAYLSELDGDLGIIDLNRQPFSYRAVTVNSISNEMTTSCHDVGLDPIRELAFCAAYLDETYILDVSDPLRPSYVTTINNPALSRHHAAQMASDGSTLVLQAEFDHPPAVPSDAPAGLWFYDLTDPLEPQQLGSWAPESCEPTELAERACSSHGFNFVPGTPLVVASWRHEGLFLVDFTDPSAPLEVGFLRPTSFRPGSNADFWSAYYWHGFVYANSGQELSGLFVMQTDLVGDLEPSAYDEGTSWGRWTADG